MANDTTIRISAIDQTREAFRSVQSNISGLTGGLKSIAGPLAAAFSTVAIVGFSKSLIDAADALGDLAEKTGISATELSRLQNAAALNGSTAEELSSSIVKLQKSIVEASTGSKSQKEAFEALGVSIKDANGNLLPTVAIFEQIADRFAGAEDGAEKVKIAQDLLGKSGANLIPVLNQGSAALRQYQSTFSDDFVKQAGEFNDNLDKLSKNFQSLAATILGPVVSAFNKFFEFIERGAKREALAGTFDPFLEDFPQRAEQAAAGAAKATGKVIENAKKNKIILKQEIDDFVTFNEEIKKRIDELDYRKFNEEMNAVQEGVKMASITFTDFGMNAVMSLEDALLGLMNGTKSVKDAFKEMAVSIMNDLLRMYIRYQITKPLFDAFFGSTTAPAAPISVSTPPVPTGRAIGGSVSQNTPYMVGERGPEMFVPNANGAIIPTDKMQGGGGVTINQTLQISTGVAQTVRTEIMSMMPRIAEVTKAAVADSKLRGGSFGKAFA